MSDVKRKVINIVLGKGSEPIPETVTITENQFVATVPVSLSIDQVKLKIDEWGAESTPELEEPLATNLADSMELFSGGVVPEGTFYLVGEQPSDHVLPHAVVQGLDMASKVEIRVDSNGLDWDRIDRIADEVKTWPDWMKGSPVNERQPTKPKIKFRTYGAGGKYLLPQLSESNSVAHAFHDAHRMPQIVL